jgi:hypothetical protein
MYFIEGCGAGYEFWLSVFDCWKDVGAGQKDAFEQVDAPGWSGASFFAPNLNNLAILWL